MFGWIRKLVIKSLINDAIKELPKYKDIATLYVEQHIEEIIGKVFKAIQDAISKEIAKALNK